MKYKNIVFYFPKKNKKYTTSLVCNRHFNKLAKLVKVV